MRAPHSLASITKEAVEKAIAEYDSMGRETFLRKFGFHKARDYRIVVGTKEYDSKAIMGAAHAYSTPGGRPLKPGDFSGGKSTVVKKLRSLGFNIPNAPRNDIWRREELILALDLYFRAKTLSAKEIEVECQALASTLDKMGHQIGAVRTDTYRNRNGVRLKLMNFRRLDPELQRAGKVGMRRGAKAEEAIWTRFADDRSALQAQAKRIVATLDLATFISPGEGHLSEDPYEAEEGSVEMRLHKYYERDRSLIRRKKSAAAKNDLVFCEACGFDFGKRYGKIAAGFIEVHHKKPVHRMKKGETTKLADLALVCSNCHRIAHMRSPPLGIEDIRMLLDEAHMARKA
jgi:5-methylcytosine-specific restriction protein A